MATDARWPTGISTAVAAPVNAYSRLPTCPYLEGTGALDAAGRPLHRHGVPTTVPGLGYVGLEYQRSISSATIRGVGRDAAHVLGRVRRRITAARPDRPTPAIPLTESNPSGLVHALHP